MWMRRSAVPGRFRDWRTSFPLASVRHLTGRDSPDAGARYLARPQAPSTTMHWPDAGELFGSRYRPGVRGRCADDALRLAMRKKEIVPITMETMRLAIQRVEPSAGASRPSNDVTEDIAIGASGNRLVLVLGAFPLVNAPSIRLRIGALCGLTLILCQRSSMQIEKVWCRYDPLHPPSPRDAGKPQ